jgi:hypothetical protein
MKLSVFPTAAIRESDQWGRERSGVYHSFSRAQARFLHFTIYSARIGLLAQANRNWF